MNPLHWKREHQVALIGAAMIGAALACLLAVNLVSRFGYSFFSILLQERISYRWVIILFWSLFGASIGGGIVYVQRLLRA